MGADAVPSAERAGVLILHRPQTLTPGAARRIHVFLDDQQIADLEMGGTARVPSNEGPHLLRARCLPLIGAELPFVLAPYETLRVNIYVGALEELSIDLDCGPSPADAPESPDPASPGPQAPESPEP
jgi:hypothetical protein